LAEIEALMNEVEEATTGVLLEEYAREGILPSDPLIDAAQDLFEKLRVAVREAAMRGRELAEAAVDEVVATWERWSIELGDQATDLLSLFQDQVWRLVVGALSAATRRLPGQLDADAWNNGLKTISAKVAWSATPSVRASVDGWLSIAVGAGLDLTATYERVTESPPAA